MLKICREFRDEVDELHDFLLKGLRPEDWERETGFMSWTPWDVVAHLHFFDLSSMQALSGTYSRCMVAKSGWPVFGHRQVNSGISMRMV